MKTTSRTPLIALTTLSLSLGAIACGGGSISVEDGTVTESREAPTLDGLDSARVRIRYPEERLLAGDVPELDIVLVRVRPPARLPDGVRGLKDYLGGHEVSLPEPPAPTARTHLVVACPLCTRHEMPSLSETQAQQGLQARLPSWMSVTVEEDRGLYEVRLVKPDEGPDDRVDPAVLGR